MLGVIKRDWRCNDLVVLRHRSAPGPGADTFLVFVAGSSQRRHNTIDAIDERIIIIIYHQHPNLERRRRRRSLLQHHALLVIGTFNVGLDQHGKSGWWDCRKWMLSLAGRTSRYAHKSAMLAQIAKVRGDALRPALHALA